MKRVGFLGSFSIDNAGDAIVGYAGRQALRELVPDCEQTVFAPNLPQGIWGHDWGRERGIDAEIVPVPAGGDMSWARGLDALVIGGGGIINLDPAFRPFMLGEPERWDPGQAAAWNGVCSLNQPWYLAEDGGAYEAVRQCTEKLRYVSVRNRTTLSFVRRCGFTGEVHVVPDPALLLSMPPDVDPAVDGLLAESGVDRSNVVVGVSIGSSLEDPRTTDFYRDLFEALVRIRKQNWAPIQIVVIPWSYMRGDERIRDIAAVHLPGAVVIRRRLRALELWRLVGKMSFFIATRYHAMLAAFAQDVPFVVLDEYLSDLTASSKTREFIIEHGLEPNYLCPFLERNPSWKVTGLIQARARMSFAGAMEQCRSRLRAHYGKMVTALGLG
jgi:hypothetical protein